MFNVSHTYILHVSLYCSSSYSEYDVQEQRSTIASPIDFLKSGLVIILFYPTGIRKLRGLLL